MEVGEGESGEREEGEEGEEAFEGRREEGKNDRLKEETISDSTKTDTLNSVPTTKVDLEQYSLFLSVASYIVLLSAVCVDIVKPATGQSWKKKKKRAGSDESEREMCQKWQHASLEDVVSYIEDLSSLLREVSRPFQPIPSVKKQLVNLQEELRRCQPPFEDKDFEWSVCIPTDLQAGAAELRHING